MAKTKKQIIHYTIIVLAVMLLENTVYGLLARYLPFLTRITLLGRFISLLIIIVIVDLLLHRFYLKEQV